VDLRLGSRVSALLIFFAGGEIAPTAGEPIHPIQAIILFVACIDKRSV
jgi:hypothetical protein